MMEDGRGMRPLLPELRRELDRLFGGFLGTNPLTWAATQAFPNINVWEDQERLFAEAEVPGLRMEDLEILVHGNELTIKGLRRPAAGENLVFHRRERSAGEFTRMITLPMEVDADRVEASLRDGVLLITMPKTERARARKIAVKAG